MVKLEKQNPGLVAVKVIKGNQCIVYVVSNYCVVYEVTNVFFM